MDVHSMMASRAFSVPLDKVEKWQRQAGKVCIAEGQLVLTDRGLVPIEKINLDHRVWDGVEWVSHDGVICNGKRDVMTYDGLTATPDHEVCSLHNRTPLWEIALRRWRINTSGNGAEPVNVRFSNSVLSWRAARDIVFGHSRVYDLLNAGPRYRFTVSNKLVSNCGFGILNGMTAKGLVNQFILYRARRKDGSRWTEDDCEMLIREWFATYPGVKKFQEACVREAEQTGLARETIGGRIRYVPQIWSPIPSVREEAGRFSYSHRIQSGANAILRRAMKVMWDNLRDVEGVQPLIPVHDEMLWELPDTEEMRILVETVVTCAFTQTTRLRVPIEAEGGFGMNWGEAHQ